MPPRHHVLLIGIDAYDGGGSLTGCVNDIDIVQQLLVDRVGIARDHIKRLAAPRVDGGPHRTDVPEELPTLDNIRAALTRLSGADVNPDDRVFIYYSGHGTQCVVTGNDGRRFSREALLPKDKKRGAEYRLLFDWELNTLLARIAARAPTTVILDCCCAAGATRDIGSDASVADRFWPTPEIDEPAARPPASAPTIRGVAATLATLARCYVVSACRDDQRARESVRAGQLAHGELTRALVTRLMAVPTAELADLRWGRIWHSVEAAVREANPRQSPLPTGNFGRRVFGFGPDEDADAGFAIAQVPSGYHVDVGTLAGVTPGAEIGVYGPDPPAFPPLGSAACAAARKGAIRVTSAGLSSCNGVAVEPFVLPDAPRGRLLRAGHSSRLRVALSDEDAALTTMLESSPLIELVQLNDAELTLARRARGGWALTDDVHGDIDGEPVLAVIPADRIGAVRAVVEHYHGYVTPLRMARTCRDLPSLLRLWLLDCGETTIAAKDAQDPTLPQLRPGKNAPYEIEVGGRIAIAVDNTAGITLYVSLFDCAASGRVLSLGSEKAVPKRSKHVFWLWDRLGEPFVASLPDDREIGADRIVAIATTRPDAPLRYLTRDQSFEELIHPTRAAGTEPDRDLTEPAEMWTSAMTTLRIVRAPIS
jgi:hypothetical protein